MADFIFYSFAFFTVLSGILVISLKNPVHAVLSLIFAFFNAAGLFILLGAEFIAMTLVIVYVGAVAVLFLFVVMMLNVDIAEMRQGFLKHLPLGIGLGALVLIQIYYALQLSSESFPIVNKAEIHGEITNTEALGRLIYTDYFLIFQGAGVILLIAMVGAIVLTLSHSKLVRRQNIGAQILRSPTQAVSLVDVKSGEGVNI
jgi:NADH-quinone oxidoreductase subunit J